MKRKLPPILFGAIGSLLLAIPALAGPRICVWPEGVPLPPEVQAALAVPDGPAPETWGYQRLARQIRQNRRAVEAGTLTPAQAEQLGGLAVTGTKKFPVLPYLYSNSGAAPYTPASVQEQLFDGPFPTGTMAEFYREMSYAQFSVGGTVYDWFTLSQDDDYYEGNSNGLNTADARTDEIMIECLDARDAAIDFGQFDNDGPDGEPNSEDDDGYVDFIMFLTPDRGGECLGNDNIWSHAWFLANWGGGSYETDDPSNAPGVTNVRINRYFISAGLDCASNPAGIGTVSHEFGHALDIKDLYDTTPPGAQDSEGLGHWGLMAAGNWNTQAHPAHMTAWSKERLGWLNWFNVTQDIEQLCLPPVEFDPVAVRMWSNAAVGPEYFVIENRQRIGFDDNLWGNGLVIYHVDEDVYDANAEDNDVNGNEAHKAIDVECADATTAMHVINADDLDTGANRGDAGDVWCSATQTEFSATSIPDTRAYSGSATGVGVYNIGDCDGSPGQPDGWICADYLVGIAQVGNLCMHDCSGDGCAEITNCAQWWGSPDIWIDNDDDGASDYPAMGVDNHLWFRVENTGPTDLANVEVELYYADPAMGQLWPSTGTFIGSHTIPVMNPGDVVEDYVVFHYTEPPAGVTHYCIGAIAVHGGDPQNSEYPPNDNNVAQVNHQVLVARAGGKSARDCPGPFSNRHRILLMAGDNPEGIDAGIRLGTPPEYQDVEVPDNWTLEYSDGPWFIPAGQPLEWFLTVQSNEAEHGQSAHIPVTLVNVQTGEPVGGVVLDYLIDCHDPLPPQEAVSECLDPRPDDLGGANVKLSWPPVAFDVEGGSEIVSHYQIFRQDNQGTPEAMIAEVAIDAEPGEAGFQFYDTAFWDTGWEYRYRARTVDATGIPGPFSDAIVVACGLTATPGDEGVRLRTRLDPGVPNPFNPATTISFHLERSGPVRLEIFDTAGRLVRTLVTGALAAGPHEAVWDGRNDRGDRVPSGVYFSRLTASGVQETQKLMLVK